MQDINQGNADSFLVWMKQHYSDATVARQLKHSRLFFKSAMRHKIIRENPFIDLKIGSETNDERLFFITREMTAKLLDACPTLEWKLIISLARFGGLRTPSETLALRLDDVNWEMGKIRIDSPKTGVRYIPLFPELRPILEQAWEAAPEGATHFITRQQGSAVNWRTYLLRIIRNAGLKPWPRLFQNMRSSRETELAQQWPLHVATAWIGNSCRIAAAHYLQVQESDFQRAAKSYAENLQNPMQQQSAVTCTDMQDSTQVLGDCTSMHIAADCRKSLQDKPLGGTGFEPVTSTV